MTVAAGVLTAAPRSRSATIDILLVVGCFAVSRTLLLAVGAFVLGAHPNSGFSANPLLPDLFVRWDSDWYIELAQHGYSIAGDHDAPGQTNYAFYPLYPLLMWLLSHATGVSLAMAGLLLSNVCFLAALGVIFLLAERWSDDRNVARLTVALLCFVPEGFVFSAVYTESLFLLLTSAAMLLFERKQNLAAGICAGLSSAVRSNGVFIVVYFVLSLWRERQLWRDPAYWVERALPIVMAPLGLFAFWWLAMLTTGDAFAQKSTILHGWGWQATWPWVNIVSMLGSGDGRTVFLMASSLVMFAASLSLLRRTTWPLFVYCLINFLLFWVGTNPNSLLRYSIVLFPIYVGLARLCVGRPLAAGGLLALFVAGDAFLMGLWAIGSGLVL